MRTAWVNRHAEAAPGAERADHEWRDLWGLAELVGGRGPNLGRGASTPRLRSGPRRVEDEVGDRLGDPIRRGGQGEMALAIELEQPAVGHR